MMKVDILERFTTKKGEFILIEMPDKVISVGDVISVDSQELTVQGIQFPTTPLKKDVVLLKIA